MDLSLEICEYTGNMILLVLVCAYKISECVANDAVPMEKKFFFSLVMYDIFLHIVFFCFYIYIFFYE